MNKNRIFIFEFVSGGGFNRVEIPSSLFCEGYGMLRSIIADFKAIDFEVFTLLDYRITFLSDYLNADYIKEVNTRDNFIKVFKESVKECEFCFIIAPEFSNILYDLTKIASNNNKKILSVGLEGIVLGASKIKTFDLFRTSCLLTPQTYLIPLKKTSIDKDFIIHKMKKFMRPIIIKPNDGVGAESIFYFESEEQVNNFFQKMYFKIDPERKYILQEYVEGKDLSVSLINYSENRSQYAKNPILIGVNSQVVDFKNQNYDSEYFGGCTPTENFAEISEEISDILKKMDLSKFNGYFGIDFIRANDNKNLIHFIEINPRITTSYIGIRNIIDYNLAELILCSFNNSKDEIQVNCNYHSMYLRLELTRLEDEPAIENEDICIPELMRKIPELITPPISLENGKKNQFSCFIATKEKTFNESQKKLNNIKSYLETFNLS